MHGSKTGKGLGGIADVSFFHIFIAGHQFSAELFSGHGIGVDSGGLFDLLFEIIKEIGVEEVYKAEVEAVAQFLQSV